VDNPVMRIFDHSALRELVLSGVNALPALLEEVEKNRQRGIPTLPALTTLTIIHVKMVGLKQVEQMKRYTKPTMTGIQTLLPNLERLTFHNTHWLSSLVLPFVAFLESIAPRLTHLGLLNVDLHNWRDLHGRNPPRPRRIKNLILDLASVESIHRRNVLMDEDPGDGNPIHSNAKSSTIMLDSLEFLEVQLMGDPWTSSRVMPEAIYHQGVPESWDAWLDLLPPSLKELRFITYLAQNQPYSKEGVVKALLDSGSDGEAFFRRRDLRHLKVSFEERKVFYNA